MRRPDSEVIRRVGGLEESSNRMPKVFSVIRRVGGLEDFLRMKPREPVRYPPCRWFRRSRFTFRMLASSYPPCRWFRSNVYRSSLPAIRYPPCRRFKNVSSRPFFEKFRHLAAGTLAFDPVHDLGKLSAVEDEGKAPIPGVDTLPTLWVGSLCIHECPLLDVLPSALLPQYRGRFVF